MCWWRRAAQWQARSAAATSRNGGTMMMKAWVEVAILHGGGLRQAVLKAWYSGVPWRIANATLLAVAFRVRCPIFIAAMCRWVGSDSTSPFSQSTQDGPHQQQHLRGILPWLQSLSSNSPTHAPLHNQARQLLPGSTALSHSACRPPLERKSAMNGRCRSYACPLYDLVDTVPLSPSSSSISSDQSTRSIASGLALYIPGSPHSRLDTVTERIQMTLDLDGCCLASRRGLRGLELDDRVHSTDRQARTEYNLALNGHRAYTRIILTLAVPYTSQLSTLILVGRMKRPVSVPRRSRDVAATTTQFQDMRDSLAGQHITGASGGRQQSHRQQRHAYVQLIHPSANPSLCLADALAGAALTDVCEHRHVSVRGGGEGTEHSS